MAKPERSINNISLGRFYSCMFNAFLLWAVTKLVNDYFKLGLSAWVGTGVLLSSIAWQLWKVSAVPRPPPDDHPFSHM